MVVIDSRCVQEQTMANLVFKTTEMHTGGDPVRIIESGYPEIKGNTILEKRRYMMENLDHLRKFILFEPRGHNAMFAVKIVEPDVEGADFGAIFMDTEGYVASCGHATMSLGRYAIDHGLVKNPTSPETRVRIQWPSGSTEAFVKYNGGVTGDVRFRSVPAFVFQLDVEVDVPGYGKVLVDVASGGAVYGIAKASGLGINLDTADARQIIEAEEALKAALKETFVFEHPGGKDLSYIFSIMLTDGKDQEDDTKGFVHSGIKNLCRAPCGSGVSARVAVLYKRNKIRLNQPKRFYGITGSYFTAAPVQEVKYGKYDAVIVEVSGKGHYTGSATFTYEDGDTQSNGFLVQ